MNVSVEDLIIPSLLFILDLIIIINIIVILLEDLLDLSLLFMDLIITSEISLLLPHPHSAIILPHFNRFFPHIIFGS